MKEVLKILDLGCNNCEWAANEGYTKHDYIGLDANEKALKIAKSRGHNVMKYNLESKSLPFKDSVFDMVIAKDILEHIYSFIDITKEINRVLKPDGKLFVSVPAEFSFILWDDYTHKRAFSVKGITSLLEDCNFYIDTLDRIAGYALSLRLINLIYPRLATQSYSIWCHKMECSMINKNETISFCIPVYNCEDTIGRCIESILDLTYPNKEIIIVNDGSNDGTVSILKKYPIKIIDLEQNMGRGYARQTALEQATGKYVALLDADGFITHKNWAEKMLSNFTGDRIAAVFSLSRAINSESSIARYWDYLTTSALTPGQITHGAGTGNTLIKKSVLDEVGGFDKRLRNAEDSDLSEKISRRGYVFYYEPDCLMSREQPSSIKEVIKKETDYAFWHGKRAYYNNNYLKLYLVRFLVFLALPVFILYCLYKSLNMYFHTKDFASFWFLFFKPVIAVVAPFVLLSSLFKNKL